jgi:hypothetical protein
MNAVAREMADAAVVNGGGVLFGTAVVALPVEIDAVDTLAQAASVQADAGDGATECGDIEQALRGGNDRIGSCVVIGHERDPPWHLTIFGATCSFFVHYGIIARGLQSVFDK